MTPAEARYLTAIDRMRADRPRVTVNGLARALDLRPASVSQMLGRLAGGGLVARDRSGAVALTEAGDREVRALAGRRAVVERFLREVLRVPEDDLATEADRLAATVSGRLEERMKAALSAAAPPSGRPS